MVSTEPPYLGNAQREVRLPEENIAPFKKEVNQMCLVLCSHCQKQTLYYLHVKEEFGVWYTIFVYTSVATYKKRNKQISNHGYDPK